MFNIQCSINIRNDSESGALKFQLQLSLDYNSRFVELNSISKRIVKKKNAIETERDEQKNKTNARNAQTRTIR